MKFIIGILVSFSTVTTFANPCDPLFRTTNLDPSVIEELRTYLGQALTDEQANFLYQNSVKSVITETPQLDPKTGVLFLGVEEKALLTLSALAVKHNDIVIYDFNKKRPESISASRMKNIRYFYGLTLTSLQVALINENRDIIISAYLDDVIEEVSSGNLVIVTIAPIALKKAAQKLGVYVSIIEPSER